MSQQVHLRRPSRFLSALGQMTHYRSPPRIDLFWVTGFAETLHLIAMDNAVEPGTHDLRPEDIARVGMAWADFEFEEWSGGFVLHLHDGRAVYVESYSEDRDWGPDSTVAVIELKEGQDMPRLPEDHLSEFYGWASGLPELDEYLAHLKAVH